MSQATLDCGRPTEVSAIDFVRTILLPSFAAQGLPDQKVVELGTDDPATAIERLLAAGATDIVSSLILEIPPHEPLPPQDAATRARATVAPAASPVASASRSAQAAKKRRLAKAASEPSRPKTPKFGWDAMRKGAKDEEE